MDKKTEKARKVLGDLITDNDIVYVVSKREIKTGWLYVWDRIYNLIPSISDKIISDEVFYLLASRKLGRIIETENGEIVIKISIPNWNEKEREKFEQVTVGNFIYKKRRKLNF